MEVVGAAVGSILTEPFRLLFGTLYIRIKNLFKINSNFDLLKENMESLSELKQILDDDDRQRMLPRSQVQDWFKRVVKVENGFESVKSTMMTTIGNSATCMCSSMNCKLSSNIVKRLTEAKQLVELGRTFEKETVGVNPATAPIEHIPGPSIAGQPAAERNLAELMNLLRDEKTKIIGVWGMGGVGKTTLIQNLNNELEKGQTNKLFSIVIWVVVSRQRSLKAIRSQIAERLKMEIAVEESEHGITRRLYKRLEKERKFLLILDDVWDGIDLDQVGIPRLENQIGSKIILTTRSLQVCRDMSTDFDFELHRLSVEEAWRLFCEKVGEEVTNDEQIKPWTEAVLQECDGLPLAIVVVGASMRKKRNIALWKDALDALRRSTPHVKEVEEKVFKTIKWSYDSLDSEHLKSCFLFFCLFPEDFEVLIDGLVQYWLAEGLLDQQQSYDRLLDRCTTIVYSLKDACLLERGKSSDYVKMHDIVRDVGIWIANSPESGCKSIIHAGVGETQVSQKLLSNCSNGVRRISFMNNSITNLSDCKVECLEASTLFLQGNERLMEVPDSFLHGFQVLRILDLSRTKIKFLPLCQLGKLQALILRYCNELIELPPLAALSMLQVLDCSGSVISKLPEDFEKLTNLRQLDLSDTRKLLNIPTGKISKLCSLEFLNMIGSGTKWGTSGKNEENAQFEELLCLDKLTAIYIDLEDIPPVTARHVSWSKRVNSYCITVGGEGTFAYRYIYNMKAIFLNNFNFSADESIGWLIVYASDLIIQECNGIDHMLGNLVRSTDILGPFANLKSLHIKNCCVSVKHLPLEQCVGNFDLLPNLEDLRLSNVTELECLSDFSNFLGLRFTRLKLLLVVKCHQLQNLLTIDGNLRNLGKVEKIHVGFCRKLTQLFWSTSSYNISLDIGNLELWELPALEEICKGDISCASLETLQVRKCDMLQKLPLGIQNAERIRDIRGEQHWWDGLQWDSEESKTRLQPYFKPSD